MYLQYIIQTLKKKICGAMLTIRMYFLPTLNFLTLLCLLTSQSSCFKESNKLSKVKISTTTLTKTFQRKTRLKKGKKELLCVKNQVSQPFLEDSQAIVPQREEVDQQQFPQKQKNQSTGRNIFSNITRSYLRYLKSQNFLSFVFPRICQKYQLSISKDSFLGELKYRSQRLKRYIRKQQILTLFGLGPKTRISSLFSSDHLLGYEKVLQLGLKSFINDHHTTETIVSKTISKLYKISHLHQKKELLQIYLIDLIGKFRKDNQKQ